MSDYDNQKASAAVAVKPVFELSSRPIPNQHNFQFYLGYGDNGYGPWAVLGLNQTEYFVGYVGREYVPTEMPAEASRVSAGTVLNALVKTLA